MNICTKDHEFLCTVQIERYGLCWVELQILIIQDYMGSYSIRDMVSKMFILKQNI